MVIFTNSTPRRRCSPQHSERARAEAVAERGSDHVFAAAGAISSGQAEVPASQGSSTCMVCMEDIDKDSQGLTMSCGHTFCKECWLQHISIQVGEGSSCNIKCMAHKCGAICSQPCASQEPQCYSASHVTTASICKLAMHKRNFSNVNCMLACHFAALQCWVA